MKKSLLRVGIPAAVLYGVLSLSPGFTAMADTPITTTLDTNNVVRHVACSPHGWQYLYSNVTVPANTVVSIQGFRLTGADKWGPADKAANKPWVRILGPNGTVFDFVSADYDQDQYVLTLPWALAPGDTFRVFSNYRHVAIVGSWQGADSLRSSVINDQNC